MSRALSPTPRFIDPEVLATLSTLELIAKSVVEGFLAGLHRSPYHGFSLEFAEYRQYSAGDDIRRVDWKVYARSDRCYVKKYEGDTNTRLYLLIDTSKSMSFTSHRITKIDYARYLAAALAHFAVHQSDAVGLMTFDSEIRHFLPPRASRSHLMSILHELEHLTFGTQTDITGALETLAKTVRKRSLVVLISDLYQDPAELARALRFFHFRGNDVVLFHILDPMELELPISGTSTLEDVETGEQIPYSSEHSRAEYLKLLNEHISLIRKECLNVYIDYEVLNTEEPLDRAMSRYLSSRARRI